MKNKLEKIGELTETLLEYIDKSDYKDSNNHDLKNNKAYIDLKNILAIKPINTFYIKTTSEDYRIKTDMTLEEIKKELDTQEIALIGDVLVRGSEVKGIAKSIY